MWYTLIVANHRLGQNIELARRAAGLSRRELADSIGKSPSTLGEYETGAHEPPLSVLYAIADATDTPLIDLLGIQLSRADLLRALASDHEQSTNPGGDGPIRGVVIGLLVAAGDEDQE